jgi:hypothetical protein
LFIQQRKRKRYFIQEGYKKDNLSEDSSEDSTVGVDIAHNETENNLEIIEEQNDLEANVVEEILKKDCPITNHENLLKYTANLQDHLILQEIDKITTNSKLF